ncbi:hypothetical protein LPJ66_011761, partial [Kickxella alabastrina]
MQDDEISSSKPRLSAADVDMLFRTSRLSLRIPDHSGDHPPTPQQIASTLPQRRHLHHGEHAQAYILCAIPGSTAAAEHYQASDLQHFFAVLSFHIVGFQAHKGAAKPLGPQVSSTTPALDMHAGWDAGAQLAELSDGSRCCLYPFEFEVRCGEGEEVLDTEESALVFEIRAAHSAHAPEALAAAAAAAGGDRSELLEELALRVSSIYAHPHGPHTGPPMDSLVLPRRMVQAVVPTRPLADISHRMAALPPSFGTDAALVQVAVSCRVPGVRLCGLTVSSDEWHVVEMGGEAKTKSSSEVAGDFSAHGGGCCWQSVFRVSPLVARGARADAVCGLRLLNAAAEPRRCAGDLVVAARVVAVDGREFSVRRSFRPTMNDQTADASVGVVA